ncbi:TerD family protein [Streptomyces avermitilis]|uniref:TerD family protein n=1 Tax=Streptomyces avermitilis TaxID=33903 RepID=UPI0033B66D88
MARGDSVSLTAVAPGLSAVTVELGWDVPSLTGTDFDLDACAIAVNQRGKVYSDQHFVFFNNIQTSDHSITHTGDRPGDEAIHVNLAALPADIDKVVFAVAIYDADSRGQTFGQVHNAYIRIVNQTGGAEIARYDLSEGSVTATAMILGELYRNGADWKFRAVGQGYVSGLASVAQEFGVNV